MKYMWQYIQVNLSWQSPNISEKQSLFNPAPWFMKSKAVNIMTIITKMIISVPQQFSLQVTPIKALVCSSLFRLLDS